MEIGCYSAAVVGDTLKAKLEALKEIGYDFLELTAAQDFLDELTSAKMDEIVKTAKDARFPIKSLSMGAFSGFAAACKEAGTRKKKIESIEKAIELAHRLGAEVILCASWEPEAGPDVMERFKTYVPPLGDKAASKGVKLAIEHIGSSKFLNSPMGVKKIAQAVNHEAVGVYFDIGNAIHAGEDPVAAIPKLGDLLFQIHLKGMRDRPLGMMPLDAVLAELENIGYTGRGATEVIQKDATDNGYLAEALQSLRAHGF
jgi:sugar phosphate isomerase/epimerase